MPEYAAGVPLRVCVAGVTGWTGRAVAEAVGCAEDLELVAGVSRSDPTSFSSVEEALDTVPADVVVDYTHSDAVKGHVLAALDRRVAVVVGSSGLSAADYAEIDERARQQGVGVIAAGLAHGGTPAPVRDGSGAPSPELGGDRLREPRQARRSERHRARARRALGCRRLADDCGPGGGDDWGARGARLHRRDDAGALPTTAEL